jgi:hypothetical protein
MSRILRFHFAVAGNVAAAIIWYRNNRPGLDADFQRAFDTTIAAIERKPLQYQVVERGMRRAMLHGFPYAVMYTVLGRADIDRRVPAHAAQSGGMAQAT